MNDLILIKCIIEGLSTDFRSFTCRDMRDNSTKEIFLSGKQRMHYTEYKVGNTIYAALSANNEWKLVTDTMFKRSDSLSQKRKELDSYFDNLEE